MARRRRQKVDSNFDATVDANLGFLLNEDGSAKNNNNYYYYKMREIG